MATKKFAMISSLVFILFFTTPWSSTTALSSSAPYENFIDCLALHSGHSKAPIYTPNTTSYTKILQFSIQNLRFSSPTTPKPQLIITPSHESQVQAAVICSRKHALNIKVRSGGHDFEGLSYTSDDGQFIMIDLINLRTINVSIENNSAWVQAGATLGEVYYRIAEKSPVHGFPSGICPTVGVGGHISGGGFGNMLRKYGVSADHVVDARLVDASGKILNRESMGEDLFWAIRGGGAASFAVLLAWEIKLVPVPPTVTVSFVDRTLEQDSIGLVHKWQSITSTVPDDLFIGLRLSVVNNNATKEGDDNRRTVGVVFQIMFLGHAEKLLQLMEEKFPELGMKEEDCKEMSWIESVLNFVGLPNGTPVEVLLNRSSFPKVTFKGKSDFVKTPISITGLEGVWKKLLNEENPEMLMAPWGGKMGRISEQEIPLPHRAGNLFVINYNTYWNGSQESESEKHINWIRELYDYMGPYVSQSPRTAFFNFKDLDLGRNVNGSATYSEARRWGRMYFMSNFERLVKVKSKVDPDNFFRNEQSIPPIPSLHGRKTHY